MPPIDYVLGIVGQTLAIFLAVFGWFISWRKAQMARIDSAIANAKAQVTGEIEENRARIKKLEEDLRHEIDQRTASIERIHELFEKIQNEVFSELQHRLANVEGELKGIRDTLTLIQGWFISNKGD